MRTFLFILLVLVTIPFLMSSIFMLIGLFQIFALGY